MNFIKKVLFIVLILVLVPALVAGASVLFPYQGGTGIGSVTSGDVGKFLAVSSTNPFTYKLVTVSGGGSTTSTLQDVTTNGNTTTNQIQFAGGTSTAAFRVQGVFTAPTGSFTYIDATTTNATFATVGTLTGSNATVTNVSSTNVTISSTLNVTGATITGLSSSNLSNSSNICLLNGTQSFTGVNTFATTTVASSTIGTANVGNFTVTNTLSLPNNSITDAMVAAALTLNGSTIDNSTIGATTPSTGVFTNATSTNLFATNLTATNGLFTSVTTTNLVVNSKQVCLADGTNCPSGTASNLQTVATAGNTTSLALIFAGGTSTANFVVTGTFSAQTTTLGTVTAGTWAGSSIATTYTDAKLKTLTGTTNRITVGGTATDPTVDISTSYAGQNTITTLGTVATGVWNGTKVSEAYGGTNQSTYTLGDTLYASAANILSKLPGNTATTRKFYRQTGDGANSAAPAWDTITAADVPGAALTKTDDTNVTLTLGGSPTTALLNATSLTLGWTGQLGLTRGGTGASLTASNGGICYSTGSALAILAGTATANKVLMSGASGAPSWSVPTYPNASATAGKIIRSDGTNFLSSTSLWPDTTTINQILYSSAANTVTGITTANNGVLITSAGGVPSIGSTLPSAVQGNITSVGTLTGLTVSGLASLASSTITGNATTTVNQVIGGTLSVTGASTLTGNVTAAGTLTVTSSVTNTLKLATNGFTKLGELAPSIKYAYVTGTLPSVGGENSYSFPTGVNVANVIGISAMAVAPGLSSSAFANNTCAGALIGDVFCYQIYNYSGTIYVDVSSSGTSIAGGNFIIIIQYSDTPLVVQN